MVRHSREEAHFARRRKKWLESAEGWVKANLLYDFALSSGRLPSPDSIREALFISVWWRRQEIEASKLRVLAQGLAAISDAGNHQVISEAYKAAIESLFPHTAKAAEPKDRALLDKMEKEVKQGPLFFAPISMSSAKASIKKMNVPDDFKKKLNEKSKKRNK